MTVMIILDTREYIVVVKNESDRKKRSRSKYRTELVTKKKWRKRQKGKVWEEVEGLQC